jgi:hypothetical protein
LADAKIPLRKSNYARFEPNIATVATLIAEPSRAAILWQLADERAVSAGELTRGARIFANGYFGQTQGDADSSFSVAASAG